MEPKGGASPAQGLQGHLAEKHGVQGDENSSPWGTLSESTPAVSSSADLGLCDLREAAAAAAAALSSMGPRRKPLHPHSPPPQPQPDDHHQHADSAQVPTGGGADGGRHQAECPALDSGGGLLQAQLIASEARAAALEVSDLLGGTLSLQLHQAW